jgi:hypothetical protein
VGFEDAFSLADRVASNDRMIDDLERRNCVLTKELFAIFPGGDEEYYKGTS